MKIGDVINGLLSRAIHFVRLGVFIGIVGLLTIPLFSPSSASSPLIAFYAVDCTTTKTTFDLGDTVCVKASGLDFFLGLRFALVDPAGFVIEFAPIDNTFTHSFTLPATDTSTVAGVYTVDNRGAWKVSVISGRGSALATAPFLVQGATHSADLSISKGPAGGTVNAGETLTFVISVTNSGPNDAVNVQLSDPTPLNASLQQITKISGPAFTCSGSACTGSVLAAGESAIFEIAYTAGAAGTTITNVVSVSSDTAEINNADNTSTSVVRIGSGGTPSACVIECPNNITTSANATQGTQQGKVVTFPTPESFGSCGTVTSTPASGSFFPVGTTQVTSTSATGGGTCSFTVTVIVTAPPTISCPANITTAALPGASSAYVPDPGATSSNPGIPTVTGSNVTFVGDRSDGEPLTAVYSIGATTITWTVTDDGGRTASCNQLIIVTSPEAPTISCPADRTFAANTGDCQKTLTAGDIGTPTVGGTNVTVDFLRSDGLALTDPYPAGPTGITWIATNNIGSASCTETITITTTGDTTPPTLTIPPDINVTTDSCSAVLDDELGIAAATDNCTASVTITRTGIPRVPCPTQSDPGRTCESFIFPTGTTDIVYTATDASGNSVTKTQHVTVHESTPPTITAPSDLTFTTGAGATSCGVVVADATLGTATANDNCPGVTVTRTGVPAGNFFPVGSTVVTYTATDASGNTATAMQTITVVDNAPPVVTPPAAVTLNTGSGATSCGVTVSNLDATLGTGSATDNCPNVGAVTRSGVPAGNTFPLGTTTLTYSVTDAHGNSSSANQVVTVVDNTPPVISCPANMIVHLPLNSTATSMVVSYPPATATDNCAGPITISYSVASGSVFSVGPTSVTATATDAHNNSASCTFTVTVLYNFTGFFPPVNNLPTLNVVNAGQAIPVKFSLSGNKGLNIFAVNSPQSGVIPCDAAAPVADLTDTVTAGGSSLSYSAGSDQYIYVWKTDSSWAGTCRQLVVTLTDGSVHTANFKFR